MKQDLVSTFQLARRLLGKNFWKIWALGCLAGLPTEWGSVALENFFNVKPETRWSLPLLWLPVYLLAQISVWKDLGLALDPPLKAPAGTWRFLPRMLGAEILLSLRVAPVLMAGLVPGLLAAAVLGLQSRAAAVPCVLLLAAGLAPGAAWFARRMFFPAFILWRNSSLAESLDASRDFTRGRVWRCLRLFLALSLASFLANEIPGAFLAGPGSAFFWPGLALYSISSLVFMPAAFLLDSVWLPVLYGKFKNGLPAA